jgi:spermidine synthase
VPEVVVAAQQYFAEHNNGVFNDPRVTVVVEDGRQYLRSTAESYDVIIGDLFNVWGAGVGNLYTLEHFRTVRERLHAGGLFAQWLPLYQVSQREFGIIVRTMLEVFPQVTLWRGNFVPEKPMVALIGHTDTTPLQPDTLLASVRGLHAHDRATEVLTNALVRLKGVDPVAAQPERQALTTQLLPHFMRTVPLTFYAGNLTAHKALFQAYPLNTDNRPVLEFVAPKTPGEQGEGRAAWLTMQALTQLFEQFGPLEQDSYLQQLTPAQRDYVRAGLSYYKHVTLHRQAQLLQRPELLKEAQRWLSDYVDKLGLRRPELVLSQ